MALSAVRGGKEGFLLPSHAIFHHRNDCEGVEVVCVLISCHQRNVAPQEGANSPLAVSSMESRKEGLWKFFLPFAALGAKLNDFKNT